MRFVASIKAICVFGTRPEATKMVPLVQALKHQHPSFDTKVIITAQHRQMLDQVLKDFDIACDYDLDVMRPNQTLAETTQRVLAGITPVLEKERPDVVLVHGDTATTAAAALASYYLRIPVGHVEAGLRTGDKYAPFPEEINRRIADAVADFHFAPTERSKRNLLNEGTSPDSIFVTGNTAVDTLLMTVRDDYRFREERLNEVDFTSRRNILVEVHRRENFGQGMEDVGDALATVARVREDVQLLVSVHRNPNAREPIMRHLKDSPRTVLFDPIDYPDYVNLMSRSYLIITDSGGVQEEAPSLGVPTIVCREKTERPEALDAGTVVLVGTDKRKIVDTACDLLDNTIRYERMSQVNNPFGDGRASERIVHSLMYKFGLRPDRPKDFRVS